jgi:hypothetical protein
MQHITAARRAAITQLLLLCTVLTAPAAVRAEARGVFAADSFQADTTLAVAKNRRTGPNHTVGPVPAGAAWDGESYTRSCQTTQPSPQPSLNMHVQLHMQRAMRASKLNPGAWDCLQVPTCGQQQEEQQTPST